MRQLLERLGRRGRRADRSICPACGGQVQDHEYFDLGSAILGSSEDAAQEVAVRNRRWDTAAEFQSANQDTDIRVWRIYHCREAGAFLIGALVLTFELGAPDEFETVVSLDEKDARDAFEAARAARAGRLEFPAFTTV